MRTVSAARLRSDDLALVGFGNRNAFSETSTSKTRGVFAARDWIAQQFRDISKANGGRLQVSLDTYLAPKTDRTPRAVTISSVIAVLPGDEPGGRTYVMSSHYDSRDSDGNDPIKDAPGADDNASAVSAVIEAARAMSGHHFHATIIFAAFDGEEQGLFGSDHYANVLKNQGAAVEGDLNNDIVGASRGHDGEYEPDIVRLFSEALPDDAKIAQVNARGSENDSPSRELARFIDATTARYVPMHTLMIYRTDRFLRGGDEESFLQVGYPAIRFVEPHENFDHQHQDVRVQNGIQYGDLPQYVDFDYLARVTQTNVAALAALALAPGAPKDAKMLVAQLGYSSTLQWSPVPNAASYEIVWRKTTSVQWEQAKNVGNVTTATVPVSKDDYILGVRAIGANGLPSVVSYPTPYRPPVK